MKAKDAKPDVPMETDEHDDPQRADDPQHMQLIQTLELRERYMATSEQSFPKELTRFVKISGKSWNIT